MEILRPILSPINGDRSVPDAEIDDAIDALELRLLIDRVRACSACAGDYEDPDRTQWPEPDDESQLRDDRVDREALDEDNSADNTGG